MQATRARALKEFLSQREIPFQENATLAPFTTLRIGGPARFFVTPTEVHQWVSLIPFLTEHQISFALLGRGSNLLVPDEGFDGCCLCTREFVGIERKDNTLTAKAGTPLATLCQHALEASLTGLEFAIGIPGTVGGALVSNAGVKEMEIASVLVKGTVLSLEGDTVSWAKEDFQLIYRQSVLQKRKWIALDAIFKGEQELKQNIQSRMKAYMKNRQQTQPLDRYNCGSIFKNPLPHYAGRLIEKASLKGKRFGNVEVSQKHANFFVCRKQASSRDVLELIALVQQEVKKQFQISLEPEIQMLTSWI